MYLLVNILYIVNCYIVRWRNAHAEACPKLLISISTVAPLLSFLITMSSPPPVDYPSEDGDVEMDTGEQSMANAPPVQPLFFPGTPTTPASGRRGINATTPSTPLGSAVARHALGIPRTPLFIGGP